MKFPRFPVYLYAGGLIVGLGLVLTGGAIEISSTPKFCGSCHVMKPYFESWVTSSHSGIACVDCHIAPGLTAEIRKKYEAMSMVTRYFTGTYSTNPWAEVDDAACLRCHERRLLSGKELFGDILFDHEPHLTEIRRGIKLRCTSCHSQIVQGSHIAVTASSCILCHFKTQESEPQAARRRTVSTQAAGTPSNRATECKLCHLVPMGIVGSAELRFEHGDVVRFGMDCTSCHSLPSAEEGRVPRERCLTCHNEPSRLVRYEETVEMHRTHVTDHKVDCMNCHLEIEHASGGLRDPDPTSCSVCHDQGHNASSELYAGIGGKGVPAKPDVMHRAGVRCEGCHLDIGRGAGARKAGEASCMSCHGPGYRKIYRVWSKTLQERTLAVDEQLEKTIRSLGSPTPIQIADARANIDLVRRGKGVHNFEYSLSLLDAAHRQINEARTARGKTPLSTPWLVAPYASDCLECHAGVETLQLRVFGRSFSHSTHIVAQGIECGRCHSTHGERDAEDLPLLALQTIADCSECHHEEVSRGACRDCHGSLFSRVFETEHGSFKHSIHVEEMEIACEDCHVQFPSGIASASRETCAECHD